MTCLAILCQLVGLVVINIIFVVTGGRGSAVGFLIYLIATITYYVTVEELLKLFFSLKSRDSLDDPINQITKVHTITSTATALGYSMCTGTIWTFFISMALAEDDEKDNEKYSLFGWLFLSTLIIAVIGMPMHLITGYITGCKITQKDMEWAEEHRDANNVAARDSHDRDRVTFRNYIPAVYINIMVRSVYLFFLIVGFLVIQFSIGGVCFSLAGIIVDYFLLICHAKKVEAQLPFDYLQRAGQLSMFGYNMLADDAAGIAQDEERAQLSQPEDMGNDMNQLDFNDNQVVITAASMDQFGSQMKDKMVVGQFEVGDEPEMVVAVDSESEKDQVQSSPGGGLKVPNAVLDDTYSNSEEDPDTR